MTLVTRLVTFTVLALVPGCRVHYVEPVDYSLTNIVANDPRGVWLAIRPSQCSMVEPWREAWVAPKDGSPNYSFGSQEMPILLEYCSKQGILVRDAATRTDDSVQCSACTCPAHYRLFLLVDEADVAGVVALGGKTVRSDE